MKNIKIMWVLRKAAIISTSLLIGSLMLWSLPASAVSQTQSGAVGLQGIIPSPPPSRGATIAVPTNGASFSTLPITVSGICPTGLLVKVFDNNVLVGSVVCSGGSYSLQIDLFSGQNSLVADVYDALNQEGPPSNTVVVTFNYGQFSQFGTQLTISSVYAEKGAAPGTVLTWPIIINGGRAPYALSVDWGDGSSPQLLSEEFSGTINLTHTYSQAGVYTVIIKATDKNGETAFLQLVGQATGAIQSNSKSSPSGPIVIKQTEIWPAIAMIPLIFAAFWAGRHYQTHEVRKQMERIQRLRS